MTDASRIPLPAPTGVAMSLAPTAEEAAAIAAACEVLWPRPPTAGAGLPPRNTAWRFGNRWWSLPLPVRRERPWR